MSYQGVISPKLPRLVADYLDGNRDLEEFYEFPPTAKGIAGAKLDRLNRNYNRETLADVLLEQANQSQYISELSLQNIIKLRKASTLTITTGHQLCLYGGPLYFIYKIASVIKLAESLSDAKNEIVPVFWMASEDHDFDEVNHFYINQQKFEWITQNKGAVGRIGLHDIISVRALLRDFYSEGPHYSNTLETLEKIFDTSKTLAQATRDFVYWIFSEYGIVVLDADDLRLKSQFVSILKKELSQGFSKTAVESCNARLNAFGYHTQINAREINLFWMENNIRVRMEKDRESFTTKDNKKTWTISELDKIVDTHPENFSPNVVLRPVYQECLLPNIAYVGGPGEISYWLQLKEVFKASSLTMPAIVLRDMAIVLNQHSQKTIKKYNLQNSEILNKANVLQKALHSNNSVILKSVTDKASEINRVLDELAKMLSDFDINLERSARGEYVRINKRLDFLKHKVLKSEKRKHFEIEHHLKNLENDIYPCGQAQERCQNWLAITNDPQKFVASLIEHFDPLNNGIKVFHA